MASKEADNRSSFGQRLTQARESKKLSKVALGYQVGVHHSQIGRYERNEASPSADILKKLANSLGITADYLMNGTTSDMAADTISDKTLVNQFNRIMQLSEEDRKIVSELIDAFLFRQEMKQKLQ